MIREEMDLKGLTLDQVLEQLGRSRMAVVVGQDGETALKVPVEGATTVPNLIVDWYYETVILTLKYREGQYRVTNVRENVEEAGRNEPCPCGSGKKYKRCCLGGRDVTDT